MEGLPPYYERQTGVEPSLDVEAMHALRTVMMGSQPNTVSGFLYQTKEPLSSETMAARLGCEVEEVERVIDMLLEHGLVSAITEAGQKSYMTAVNEAKHTRRLGMKTTYLATVTQLKD